VQLFVRRQKTRSVLETLGCAGPLVASARAAEISPNLYVEESIAEGLGLVR
jgi:hypothetical protein